MVNVTTKRIALIIISCDKTFLISYFNESDESLLFFPLKPQTICHDLHTVCEIKCMKY